MNQPRGRPFAPGNTQGRGRPKGSANKARSPWEDLLKEYAPHLVRTLISQALKGDRSALRICIEQISPARRDAFVRLPLPRMVTAQDVDKAAEKVTQGIARGKITPADGEKLMDILDSRCRIIDSAQMEANAPRTAELPPFVVNLHKKAA